MKKYFLYSCLLGASLYAQEEGQSPPPPRFFPFSISGDYVNVSPTTFRTPDLEGKLSYRQADAAFSYNHPCNEYWGLLFGAGYVFSDINWKENPAFHQQDFTYVSLMFGAYTKSVEGWLWNVSVTPFFDTQAFDFGDYTLYQGVLQGKYVFCEWIVFNVGCILEVGLNKDKMWPILGFEYTPSEDWKINAVYPINVSVEYRVTDQIKAAGAIRFLRNRHRVGEDEPIPKGIFEYRDAGAEFDLTYKPFPTVGITGFAGSTFDGELKVTNRNDNHGTHYKFKGSFYAGASAIWVF